MIAVTIYLSLFAMVNLIVAIGLCAVLVKEFSALTDTSTVILVLSAIFLLITTLMQIF